MPAQTVVFHLQGEHDQKTHGNRGGRALTSIESILDEPPAGVRAALDSIPAEQIDTRVIDDAVYDTVAEAIVAHDPSLDVETDWFVDYNGDPISTDAKQVARVLVDRKQLARFAERNNPFDSEIDAYWELTEAVDGAPVSMRVTEKTLEAILTGDGEFKSSFETGRSGGYYSDGARARYEMFAFGLDPRATPPSERPVYGYLDVQGSNGIGSANAYDQNPGAAQGHKSHFAQLSQYGDVVVEFGAVVNPRATFTIDDSFNRSVLPSPIENPESVSFASSMNRVRMGGMSEAINSGRYVEAQIHGDTTIRDVSQIYFGSPPSDAVRAALDAQNISWDLTPDAEPSGVLSFADASSDAGQVVFVRDDGATITATGATDSDDQPVGFVTGPNGQVYTALPIVAIWARGGWEPATSTTGVEVFHLQGQHNQKDHGNRAGRPIEDLVGGSDGYSPKHQGYFGEVTFGRYHGTEDSGVYSVTVAEHGTSSGWENDKYDVEITTDEDGNMIGAEVTRRVTRNDIGNPEMAADDLNTLFEEHGVALEWGEAVVDGRRVQTGAEQDEIRAQEAREDARAAAYDTIYDAYSFDITDKNGDSYYVEAEVTVDSPFGGSVSGWILNSAASETVGTFQRDIDLEYGRVDNGSFDVKPEYQGRGIGTAFLDGSEAVLAEAGIERARLTAVDVGRYAWMARGYQVSSNDRASVVRQWVPEVESILSSREFTDVQRSQARAVVRSWESGDDVYGADLLSVSDEFADVFLNGPTYSASRELTPSPRARAWVDPNQPELDLSVEVFHLQGQHDQKDHGRRGGVRSGIDALDASDIPVMTDEYGELLITSTGVDRIRQIAYDYDGGSDVYDVVIVDNGDGTIAVDVENLYGPDGTIEGEQALERYLNDNGIDDVRWDGERGMLHASHRAAIAADDASPRQALVGKVEDAYSGTFSASGIDYEIGDVNVVSREGVQGVEGLTPVSVEVSGSILVDGEEVGSFSRAVYEDGTVYNHSLSIDATMQGFGIGTAFLEKTEGALQPEVIKMAAVNVGKYAWASRGYQLDTGDSSLAASTRDRWADSAREIIGRTVDPVVAERAEVVLRSWSDDLNSVYPADLLAVDVDRFRDVFLEGPSWDAIKRRDDPLAAAAGVEAFHLQGQHDQQSHAGGRGGEAPTPPTVEEFDAAYDVSDPVPMYDRMGIDQTIMRAADFSEGEHDASWAHAAYTLGGSEAMNKYLRGQDLPAHFQDDHATDADLLKQAIGEAEPTKHDLVVYRGLGRWPRGMEGARIRDDGFISTSLDRRVAETFGNVVEIRVPAGSKAIAGNWGEFEVILAPGTEFDVTEEGVLDVVQ